MFAIRARRKTVSEKDFLDAVSKVRLVDAAHASVESQAAGAGALRRTYVRWWHQGECS